MSSLTLPKQKTNILSILINNEWVIFLSIAVLVILLRYPSLEQPFDNDSAAIAYHARLIVQGEPLYSTHHPGHHLPAVYYTYALAFKLFGDSVWSVKFFLLFWVIASAYLVYRTGLLLANRTTGFLAANFFILLTSDIKMLGTTAEIELFANLVRIAAFYTLLLALKRNKPAWFFLFPGLFSAFSILFKANYLSPIILTGLFILYDFIKNCRSLYAKKQFLVRSVSVAAGIVLGILPVIAYFTWLGLLPQLLLVFSNGKYYVNQQFSDNVNLILKLFLPFLGASVNNFLIELFGFGCIISYLLNHKKGEQTPFNNMALVIVWYGFSYVEACISSVFFTHYYLLLVPPLALLAARFIDYLIEKVNEFPIKNIIPYSKTLSAVLLILPIWGISLSHNIHFFTYYFRYKTGIYNYGEFTSLGLPSEDYSLVPAIPVHLLTGVRAQAIADYIVPRTTLEDRVLYWSDEIQLYYQANRRAPTRMIWPVYLDLEQPEHIFQPSTKYIITDFETTRPAWFYAELSRKYTLETIVMDQKIYRRKNDP